MKWWIKAWFNNRKVGEAAILITRLIAIQFINGEREKDEWLEEYFPHQMEIYHQAIENTKEQLISQMKVTTN